MSMLGIVPLISASINVPMTVSYAESMYSLVSHVVVQNAMEKIENRIKSDLKSIINVN